MARTSFALVSALGVAVACVGAPGAARADGQSDKAKCAQAYERTQRERKAGKLRAARDQAVECGRSACAAFIIKDCNRWLGEIDAIMPSVVFSAKHGEDKDITDVSVYVDDEPLQDHLTGMAVSVDPGRHTFRFERDGSDPIKKRILIREGEKARIIRVRFPVAPASGAEAESVTPAPGGQAKERDPALAYVLGGVGIGAIGLFGYLAATGVHDENAARSGPDKCAPDCPASRVDSIKRKYQYADISLGVGVVCVGIATYLLLRDSGGEGASDPGTTARVHVDVAPTAHGAVGGVSGRF